MNTNITKTIEELSLAKTSSDLWDEINQKTNPNTLLLYLIPENKITVRFLGPFVKVARFYAPFLRYQSEGNLDVNAIAEKNPDAIKKAKDFFDNMRKEQTRLMDVMYPKIVQYLSSLNAGSMTWQRCIMVNAYVREGSVTSGGRLKILALTPSLSDAIMRATLNNSNAILSGLFSHDISITRRGEAMETRFEVDLKPPSHLPESDLNIILGNGLIDIPILLGELNKWHSSSYYYKKALNYRMPSEFTKVLLEERAHLEEDKPLEHVEEHLNDIPGEAFERRNNMREAIQSLEV
jgi:hypothetical protein